MSNIINFLGEGKSGATLSKDRIYRYCLWRRWRESWIYPNILSDEGRFPDPLDMVVFIGLNPSTADEKEDDPTIRRCAGFAKSWGYGGIAMLNLFAFRATDPADLKKAESPIGKLNDEAIGRVCNVCGMVVCCWGNHGSYQSRDVRVRCGLYRYKNWANIYHLGLTKSGQPKHPLYLPSKTEKQNFNR